MKHRMAIAALSLVGFFIALYLWLWKMGWIGELACGDGGCEIVQLSRYAEVGGIPVSLIGMVGYAVMLAVSMLGLQPAWRDRPGPTYWLFALSGAGMLYTAYLTYLEAAVIGSWCRYCVVSSIVMLAILVAAAIGTTAQRRAAGA